MIEDLELRVVEDFANRLFHHDEGKLLGSGIVRLVRIQSDDPRLCKISSIRKQIDGECGRSFFHGWEILRRYSREEIKTASLFQRARNVERHMMNFQLARVAVQVPSKLHRCSLT
jgi:hypothetical protein